MLLRFNLSTYQEFLIVDLTDLKLYIRLAIVEVLLPILCALLLLR